MEKTIFSQSSRRVSGLLISLSLLATLGLILFLITKLDLTKILVIWQSIPIHWLLLCLLLIFISHIARAGRLYYHFKQRMKGRFDLCLRVSLHHNFFNNLLPMRTGEASLPLLLRQKFAINIAKSSGALLSFRLFDLAVLSLLGLLSLMFGLHTTDQLLLLILVLLSILLIGVAGFRNLNKLSHRWPSLVATINQIRQGVPRKPNELISLTLWTLAIWVIKLVGYALILQLFIDASLSLSLLAALSGELASGIPLYTPAAIGSFEGGVLAVLLPAGIDQAKALIGAVSLHLFLLFATMVSAGLGLMLGNTAHVSR
jgi:uncharacterized membrane protein YbhN (UPF0104 family)